MAHEPDIRKDPGVKPEHHARRLPCPSCKIDFSIERLNAVHSRVFRKANEKARKDGRDNPGLNQYAHLPYEIDSSQRFESHFSPRTRTFKRGEGRADLKPHVDTYFETCGKCGLLWDPYAAIRAEELVRTIGSLADFLGLTPADLLAKLGDDFPDGE